VLYLALAVVLLCLGVIGLLGKPLLSVVILLAFSRYGLNGLYEFTASGGLQAASGVIGCVIFLFSLYGGLALGLEDAQHRTVLPFGRRGEALQAIEGDLSEQVGPIEKEAGVRKQL
jgi:succinate-acetate transporter protein